MTLTQLRAFWASVRTGSFTAAAAELGLSQASVSELVRRLEEEAGMEVFVRRGRRLVLTAAGAELEPFAAQAVQAADGGVKAVRALASLGGGTASFGLLRYADQYGLASLVQIFHERNPHVRARFVGQNSQEVAWAVAAGSLEAGLVVLPVDVEGLVVTPLLDDEVLYTSAVPERLSAPVTTAALAAAPLVLYDAHHGWKDPTRRQLAERAGREGLELVARIEVEHVDAALKLVVAGLGDTIVSRAIASGPTFPASLGTASFAQPLYDTVALISRRGVVLSPVTREIVRLARAMLAARSRLVDPVRRR